MQQKVYVQTDDYSRIISCEGGYAVPADLSGWILIDEGTGDKYNLCQIHYFPDDLTTPDGTHRYIYDPALSPPYREATAEELAAERAEIEAAREPPGFTAEEKQLDMLQEIVEMRAQLAQLLINGGM